MKRLIFLLMTVFFLFIPISHSTPQIIYVVDVTGAISPGLADFVDQSIQTASEKNGACIIIQLDTPGGLGESMRKIVKSIFASDIPVIVYVSPSGARAASAGVMVTVSADIAVMAPGTNIGAAHPVDVTGKEMNEVMNEKVINDMAAFAKTIAEKRGKNIDWVEKAVRESVSITETEALSKGVIDYIAKDIEELISIIDGREIPGKGVLQLEGKQIETIDEDIRTKILKTISDPNIAYILMMIGLAGIYFELSHPGTIFPGVVGGISLILAFFAFQTLPINYAGFLLILLSIVFFVMEMKITSYGFLSLAGVISLLLGSLMLFEGENPGFALSWHVLFPTLLTVSIFFIVIAGLVYKSQFSKPATGDMGLVGEIGVVKKTIDGTGKIFVHGELWNAKSNVIIPEGAQVRVIKVENLLAEVEPVE